MAVAEYRNKSIFLDEELISSSNSQSGEPAASYFCITILKSLRRECYLPEWRGRIRNRSRLSRWLHLLACETSCHLFLTGMTLAESLVIFTFIIYLWLWDYSTTLLDFVIIITLLPIAFVQRLVRSRFNGAFVESWKNNSCYLICDSILWSKTVWQLLMFDFIRLNSVCGASSERFISERIAYTIIFFISVGYKT